jgi:hypothetical protein
MLKLADLYRMLEIYHVDVWCEGRTWCMRLREMNCDTLYLARDEYDLEDLLIRAIKWRKHWNKDNKSL